MVRLDTKSCVSVVVAMPVLRTMIRAMCVSMCACTERLRHGEAVRQQRRRKEGRPAHGLAALVRPCPAR